MKDILQRHRSERTDLIERARAFLAADPRVAAAWLAGSLGRNDADDWSDIDLWVVVDGDRRLIDAMANEQVFQLGTLLCSMEMDHHAPPGGKYVMAAYRGSDWPHHVDWSWQPVSFATVPHGASLLFDRIRLPSTKDDVIEASQSATTAAERATWFWMMCPLAAKYIARGNEWETLEMLALLRRVPDEIRALLTLPHPQSDRGHSSALGVPVGSGAQLDLLIALAAEVESLTASLPRMTQKPPPTAAVFASETFRAVRAVIDYGAKNGDKDAV